MKKKVLFLFSAVILIATMTLFTGSTEKVKEDCTIEQVVTLGDDMQTAKLILPPEDVAISAPVYLMDPPVERVSFTCPYCGYQAICIPETWYCPQCSRHVWVTYCPHVKI